MPNLDVADVLDDPDFFDFFTVKRPAVSATVGGIAQTTTQTFTKVAGVVTPAGAPDLMLLPEGSIETGVIQIITRFALQTGKGTGFSPDIVSWHGADYTVLNTDDWSGFGAGFIKALARQRQINPPVAP
jgi:hypothetical protein